MDTTAQDGQGASTAVTVALVTSRKENAAWTTHMAQSFSLGIGNVKKSQCIFVKQVNEALRERERDSKDPFLSLAYLELLTLEGVCG